MAAKTFEVLPTARSEPERPCAGPSSRRSCSCVLVIGAPITVVPAGHVGVKDFFGSVSPNVLPPGVHLSFRSRASTRCRSRRRSSRRRPRCPRRRA